MTEPTKPDVATLGARLEADAEAAATRLGHDLQLHRATAEALEPDDYDSVVGSALADRRAATWARAIPNRFLWAQLDDMADQPAEVVDALADWSTNPDGRNLLLLGPVGVGKSHAAVAAVRAQHHDRGAEVRFFPVVELLDLLRPGGPEGALYDLADCDLLVLDDVGSERATDWTAERLYALVNRRWLEGRPSVCTTNLDSTELATAVGPRVFSRLVGNGAVALRLTGPDRRRRPHG